MAVNKSEIHSVKGTVIVLRIGTEDYHWMKYVRSGDYWIHKPANTAVLKLKGASYTYSVWYSEYYAGTWQKEI